MDRADQDYFDEKIRPHLPAYATAQSAGLDLMAAVSNDVTLAPGARQLIPTGLCIALVAGLTGW